MEPVNGRREENLFLENNNQNVDWKEHQWRVETLEELPFAQPDIHGIFMRWVNIGQTVPKIFETCDETIRVSENKNRGPDECKDHFEKYAESIKEVFINQLGFTHKEFAEVIAPAHNGNLFETIDLFHKKMEEAGNNEIEKLNKSPAHAALTCLVGLNSAHTGLALLDATLKMALHKAPKKGFERQKEEVNGYLQRIKQWRASTVPRGFFAAQQLAVYDNEPLIQYHPEYRTLYDSARQSTIFMVDITPRIQELYMILDPEIGEGGNQGGRQK